MNKNLDFEHFINVLKIIKQNDDYKEVLEGIIRDALAYNNGTYLYEINSCLINYLKCDITPLINYLTSNSDFNICEYDNELDEIFKFIKYLKNRYGVLLQKNLNRSRNPFGLQGVSVNIGSSLSHSNISIYRNDNQALDLLCPVQEILNLANAINQSLLNNLNVGVYNIDRTLSEEYLNNIKNIEQKLNELLGK